MATLNSWQRIDRVLSGKPWGDGASGSATISSDPNTRATITGTASSTSGTAGSTSFANGDVVLLHQTRGTGAGQWEINKVASGGGSTSLTFDKTLQYTYGTGSQIIKIPRYDEVTLSGFTVPIWNGSTGGISIIVAKKSITGGSVTSIGGFTNGVSNAIRQGDSPSGTGGTSYSNNGMGGGGSDAQNGGAGAGHGTSGTQGGTRGAGGTRGTAGTTGGSSDLTTIYLGSAGGSTANWGGDDGGAGGSGGGILILISKSITINSSININGSNGGNGGGSGGGGGGAGSGGSCLLVCETVYLGSGIITANGGTGGSGSGGAGGNGGVGRIAVHYKTSVSGTTSPTYTGVSEPTLKELGATGNFIPFFM